MNKFRLRVVLHDGNWSDYTNLHSKMNTAGFTDIITAGDGRRFKMPPGEYTIYSSSNLDQIQKLADRAASNIVRKHAVIVTEGQSAWSGLELA